MPTNNESKYIKEVWAENLEEEMAILRDRVEQFPFLAMVQGFFIYITNNIMYIVFFIYITIGNKNFLSDHEIFIPLFLEFKIDIFFHCV